MKYHGIVPSKKASTDTSTKPKKVDKVITGKTTIKKDDPVKTVMRGLIDDIVYPGICNIVASTTRSIFGMIQETIEAAILGEDRRVGTMAPIPYNSFYKKTTTQVGSSLKKRETFENIYFQQKSDAEIVLRKLRNYAKTYDSVSVMNFYEYTGRTSENFVFNSVGWDRDDLADTKIVGDVNGYYILFTEPKKIDY